MNSSIAEFLGLDPAFFGLVILPILIFFSRIMDVSINTMRIIYMLHGKKLISTILGFFESLIWLIAISQIFQNVNSIATYLAYAGGFASGVFVGMIIEEKLALGSVLIRVITRKPATELIHFLNNNHYRYSNVDAVSDEGKVNVLFTVIKRDNLVSTISAIKKYNPQAFYTVEGVKQVSDHVSDEKGFHYRKLSK